MINMRSSASDDNCDDANSGHYESDDYLSYSDDHRGRGGDGRTERSDNEPKIYHSIGKLGVVVTVKKVCLQ